MDEDVACGFAWPIADMLVFAFSLIRLFFCAIMRIFFFAMGLFVIWDGTENLTSEIVESTP